MADILLNNSEKIITGIVERAKQERQKMLEIAKRRAEDIKFEFSKNVEEEVKYIIHESKMKADNIINQSEAQVELYLRKQRMEHQEEIVQDILEMVKDKIKACIQSTDYLESLCLLISEGISVLEGKHFILEVRQKDIELFDAPFIEYIKNKVKDEQNRDIDFEIRNISKEIMGGVIIYQEDEGILVDHTYDKRFLRAMNDIRKTIAHNLFNNENPSQCERP